MVIIDLSCGRMASVKKKKKKKKKKKMRRSLHEDLCEFMPSFQQKVGATGNVGEQHNGTFYCGLFERLVHCRQSV